MIRQVEEYGKYVAIAGFRDVRLVDIEQILTISQKGFRSGGIQFFDAQLIAGWQHLFFTAVNALKAFKNGTNISKKLSIECLLYASAQRQIKNAVNLIGIKPDTSEIAVLAITDDERIANTALTNISKLIPGIREDGVLELSDEKMDQIKRLFRISNGELRSKLEENGEKQAICDLVIEHIALLVTQR
ncbi:MAG: hypothetical protein JSV05_04545 [Candidatus Bathyarchaeota archaeon]|nr:MAG: hypothetical protein JSV05_04545 [Candidatus Bathyarchaeota archaeon]